MTDPAPPRDDDAVRRQVEAAWRIEAPRLIGSLTRLTGDLDAAEDLAQHALLRALEVWPQTGLPRRPGGWLLTTARNAAIDAARRRSMRARKHAALRTSPGEASAAPALEEAIDDAVGDDLLRLVLIACHPVLPREGRIALTLQLLGGLSIKEIARGFFVSEAAIAQRVARARRALRRADLPFEVPRGAALDARVPSVLEVIYLIFNEGHAPTSGAAAFNRALCETAMRLARVLAALLPARGDVHGLVALLELTAARLPARQAPDGSPVLLAEQHRARWDQLLIGRGLEALDRAKARERPLGVYALQAEIAACHARARTLAETNWVRIVAFYDVLVARTGSPIVALNRAMALSMAIGPGAALAAIDALADDPHLRRSHLVPAARADLLRRLGRLPEARRAYLEAAESATSARDEAALVALGQQCLSGRGGLAPATAG